MTLLDQPEYQFLQTNPHLGKNIIFLTYGGSYSYGTNVEGSDIDIRGCAVNSKAEILGLETFEQFIDEATDTVVYSFNKLIGLLMNCNPNTIEMLGCKPEHYFALTPIGQEMIQNRKMFLSRRAINSFGGYANQQLNRLENALARDAYNPEKRAQHILASSENATFSFQDRYRSFSAEQIQLSIAQVDGEPQIVLDVAMQGIPIRQFTGMVSELVDVSRNYDKIQHRNRKKDDAHLNKHAMHLVRLYLMCLDILEKEDIITYREADHDLLMSIRNGEYQKDDHSFRPEFYDLVESLKKRMEYAKKNTSLPEQPDTAQIQAFVVDVNEKVVRGEI